MAGLDVAADAHRVRQQIGLTGQFASVDDDLTGTQNLVLIGQLLDLTTRGARARAKAALQRIAGTPNLSRDVHDIAQRALADS